MWRPRGLNRVSVIQRARFAGFDVDGTEPALAGGTVVPAKDTFRRVDYLFCVGGLGGIVPAVREAPHRLIGQVYLENPTAGALGTLTL